MNCGPFSLVFLRVEGVQCFSVQKKRAGERERGKDMCGRARCTVRVDAVGRACGFSAPLRSVNADRYVSSAPGVQLGTLSAGFMKKLLYMCFEVLWLQLILTFLCFLSDF